MGFRGTLISIAAVITIITAIFTGDSASFMQGFGAILIIFLLFAVAKVLNRE